jgi:hypothetical protein
VLSVVVVVFISIFSAVVVCGVVELDVIIFIVVDDVLLVVAGVVLVTVILGGMVVFCVFGEVELDIGVVVVVCCVVVEVELDIGVVEVVSDVVEEVVLVELTGNSVVVVVVDPSSTIRLSISSVIPDFFPSSGCVIN